MQKIFVQMKTIKYCMTCQVLLSPPKGQEFYPPFPILVQRFNIRPFF